jgi:lysyl-tRNA synthetase class 2
MADWRPSANERQLRERAALLASVRSFFEQRDIIEVETPLLCSSGVTDPAIEPLTVTRGEALSTPRFLQTSPEYAMKRLLAAGSGPIFQITRAFRDGECGARHNPEFTLLEWYRPGFDMHRLMAEVAELLAHCLGELPCQLRSYRDWFIDLLGLDPMTAPIGQLERFARSELDISALTGDRDMWLQLIDSHLLEPKLAGLGVCFIYDYPASQAALARVETVEGKDVARRFEVFVHGMELANGYHELTDAVEQRRRFEGDNARRREHGLAERSLDERLLSALADGLPDCSGVALGIDRLLMVKTGATRIGEVLAFDWSRS